MQSVNTQTLIHVGTELVVLSGMTFWFQRKTSKLNSDIEDLKKRLEDCEKIISQQNQLIGHHEQILSRMLGGAPSQQQRQQPPPSRKPRKQRSTPKETKIQFKEPIIEDDVEDEDEEDIDELLDQEMGKTSRISCDGDTCELNIGEEEPAQLKKSSKKGE